MTQPTTPTPQRNWMSMLPWLIGSFVLGAALSLVISLLLGPSAKAQLTQVVLKAVRGGVTAIITTLFTYFLVNRYLRKRERESDTIMVSYLAEVVSRLRGLNAYYDPETLPDEEGELSETIAWLRDYESTPKERRQKTNQSEIEDLLYQLRGVPAVLQAGQVRVNFIRDVSARIYTLLGVCSPKVAAGVPDCIDQLTYDLREAIEDLSYGERGYMELERIHRYAGKRNVSQKEIAEILERIAVGIWALYDGITETLEDFQKEPLKNFLAELPAYATEAYNDTLEGLKDNEDEDEE
ncbi:MAG: hypothetical protein H6727_16335 [Myxococcales bacterium]|nr:hypothetical protein [Myxococcales bacterium]